MTTKQKILLGLENDFIDFCKTIMPSTLNAPSPEIHKEWADILLDKATTVADAEVDAHGIGGLVYKEGISNKQILFVSPRDTAKSTMIGAGYALYHSIYH